MTVASFRTLGCFYTNIPFHIGPSKSLGFRKSSPLFLEHKRGTLEAVLLWSLQHRVISWFVSSKLSGLGAAAAEWLGKKEIVVKLDLGGFFCVFSTSPTHKADRRTRHFPRVGMAVLRRPMDWGLQSF